MTLATLKDVLQPALAQGYAVGGLVTLGWEDMRAYVAAAEAENAPVILQAGPSCRAHTPLPILGKMFRYLAENASVPVVAHLDHGYTFDECKEALDSGFTSLMFDGSRKPLQQNIDETAAIAEIFNAQMAPHLYAGPIEWAANVHLAVSIPNLLIAETIETPFHDQLIKGSIRVENGYIPAPTAPGLGIDVDEDLARAHPFTGTGLHLMMQDDPCDYQNGNSFQGGAPIKN